MPTTIRNSISRPTFLAFVVAAHLLFQADLEVRAGEWPYQAARDRFVFHADFPVDANQPLVSELAALPMEISKLLRIRPSDERIDVYLFRDRLIYEQYMRRHFPSLTPRRAMFIKSNSPGNVFAYASNQFGMDLRHETTHAVLHACLPMVPLWLDEGLAEYFELPAADRNEANPYHRSLRRRYRWMRPRSLVELEQLTELGQMGTEEYRDAWAWVHFMLQGPEPAKQTLYDYLATLQRHEPPAPLSQQLAARFEDPTKALAEHFR